MLSDFIMNPVIKGFKYINMLIFQRSPEIGSLHDDSEFKKSTHITAELKRRQNIKVHV